MLNKELTMTNNEAIDIIKCLAWHTRPNEEDIEQAIKALEQQTEKKCTECKYYGVFTCECPVTCVSQDPWRPDEYIRGYQKGKADAKLSQEMQEAFLKGVREAAESVKPRWILCSEKLPEENIHVLCQFYMGGMAECYHSHGMWHIVGGYRISCDEVVAYMPLPEPYREEDE